MSPRLKTAITVSALLKRAEGAGAFAAVLRKGDEVSGAYMVCVRMGGQMTLYTSERNMDGDLAWHPKGPVDEPEAMALINRRVDFDPDLWVIEIDDAQGRHFLDMPNSPDKPDARAAAEALFPNRSRRR